MVQGYATPAQDYPTAMKHVLLHSCAVCRSTPRQCATVGEDLEWNARRLLLRLSSICKETNGSKDDAGASDAANEHKRPEIWGRQYQTAKRRYQCSSLHCSMQEADVQVHELRVGVVSEWRPSGE